MPKYFAIIEPNESPSDAAIYEANTAKDAIREYHDDMKGYTHQIGLDREYIAYELGAAKHFKHTTNTVTTVKVTETRKRK